MAKKINLTKEQIEAAAKAGREKTEKAYAQKAQAIAKGYGTNSAKSKAGGNRGQLPGVSEVLARNNPAFAALQQAGNAKKLTKGSDAISYGKKSSERKPGQISALGAGDYGASKTTRFDATANAAIYSTAGAFSNLFGLLKEKDAQTKARDAADSARLKAGYDAMLNGEDINTREGGLKKQHEDSQKAFERGYAALAGAGQKNFDAADELAARSNEYQQMAKEGLGKFGQGVVDFGIAGLQFAGDAAMNAILPGSGLVAMGMRAAGSGAQEARNNGLDINDQFTAGLKSAAIEVLTEKLFGAASKVAYGKGIIKNESLVNGLANRLAKTDKGRTALKVIVGANEEGLEEVLSDILNPVADRVLKLDDGKGDWSDLGEDMDTEQMLEDYIIGSTLGLFGAGTNVISGQYRAENAQQRAYENYQRELVNAGLASEQGSQAQLTAEEYQNILDNSAKRGNRNLSDKETANLEQLITTERDTPAVRNTLERSGTLVDDNTASVIAKAASGQKLTRAEQSIIDNSPIMQQAVNTMSGSGAVANIRTTAAKNSVVNSMAERYTVSPEVISRTYDLAPVTSPEAFEMAFDAVYQMGQQGANKESLTKVPVLNRAQAEIAYNMGASTTQAAVDNAAVQSDNVSTQVNNQVSNAVNNTIQEVNNNGVRLRDSSQRLNGQNTEGQIPSVERGTVEAYAGTDSGRQSGYSSAQGKAGQKVVYNGVEQENVYYSGEDTESMKKGRELARSYGYNVTYFEGGNIKDSGGEFRGMVDTDSKTVMVRSDHPDISAEQIMHHEMGHAAIAQGDISLDELRSAMLSDLSEKELNSAVEVYRHAYGDTISETEAFEEMCCDALGKINIFAGTEHDSANYGKVQESFRKHTAETANKGRAPPKSGVKFSKEASGSIKEQLRRAESMLNGENLVATVNAPDFNKMNIKQQRQWAESFLKNTGYAVDRKGFGRIEFTPKHINEGLNYLNSPAEIAAFAALPRVLKRGVEIDAHNNHKGRQRGSVTIAAPVKINGVRGNMAVAVTITTKNHYHAHRVLLPDGSEFTFEVKKVDPTPAEAAPNAESSPIKSTADSIRNSSENVKKYSLEPVEAIQPTSGEWKRGSTTEEVREVHPQLWAVDAESSETRNPTQISGTVKSYRKIYDALDAEGFNGTILDASSGLGYGTRAGREEYGFNVDDIEPFPDRSYKPKYIDYSKLNKKYDVIISNAVLNVLPQDQRDALVVKMGKMLNAGGKMFINVRGTDVKNASSKVAIDEANMEYYISNTGSYQKGFTKRELVAYLSDALGSNYTVTPSSKFGAVSAIVTENGKFSQKNSRDNKTAVKKKFSMEVPIEEKKNLIALHNLDETKLLKTLKLGGFPMPSIAITKSDIPHTNFGDITIVFGKETIDPEFDRRNTVYSADAWTPLVPRVEYEANPKAEKRIRDKYYELSSKYGNDFARPLYESANYLSDTLTKNGGVEGMVEKFADDTRMMQVYLADTGKTPIEAVKTETVTRLADNQIEEYDALIDALGADVLNEMTAKSNQAPFAARKEWLAKHGENLKSAFEQYLIKNGIDADTARSVVGDMKPASLLNEAVAARKYLNNGAETRKIEVDTDATNKAIKAAVNSDEYMKWLKDLYGNSVKDSGFYNNKDYYTPSGNMRSFKATHFPNTLDGIVKAMTSQGDGNSRNVMGFHGTKSLRATTAERFKSIEDMHKLEGRLKHLTEEEATEINNALDSRLSELMHNVYELVPHDSSSNELIELDTLGEIFIEAAELKYKSPANVKSLFKKYNYPLTDKMANDIVALLYDINNMPVNIFEAKPERVVGFDEIRKVIIPDTSSDTLRKALKEAGINAVEEYRAGDDAARMNIANDVPDAHFSREPERLNELRQQNETMLAQATNEDAANDNERGLIKDYKRQYDKVSSIAEKLNTARQELTAAENGGDKNAIAAARNRFTLLNRRYAEEHRKLSDYVNIKALGNVLARVKDRTAENPLPEGMGAASAEFTGEETVGERWVTEAQGEGNSALHPISKEQEANLAEQQHRAPQEIPKKDLNGKLTSKHVSTIANSGMTPAEFSDALREDAAQGKFSHIAYSDEEALKKANRTIEIGGWEQALANYKAEINSGRVSKDNTVMGIALYNNAVNSGDYVTAMDIASLMVKNSTNTAQSLQAMRILNKLSPECRLYLAAKSIENLEEDLNERYKDNNADIHVDKILYDEYAKALRSGDEDGIKTAWANIEQSVAQQINATWYEKLNNFRYLAMLGNPRTHVRNIVGNAFFVPVRAVKNTIAYGLENLADSKVNGGIERSKSILNRNNANDVALIKYAMTDYEAVQETILSGGKYVDTFQGIDKHRTIYKTKILEAARKGNSAALDAEDAWFCKPAYANALAKWYKANGISAEQLNTGKVPEETIIKAQTIAIKEAQKATYRDINAFSQLVSNLGKTKYKAVNVLVEGVMPFKKTPANILARGVEYSPVGLLKSLWDIRRVKAYVNGNIENGMSPAEFIDEVSAGLTGTALVGLGVLLASWGVLSGGDDDDEKQNYFDELSGKQNYALSIGGVSITLDWLAPESMPLFVGVELFNSLSSKNEDKGFLRNLASSVMSLSTPMFEMSMLQSVNDLFDNLAYIKQGQGTFKIVSSMAANYISQYFPTLFGQTERSFEEAQRETTYIDRNSKVGSELQYMWGKIANKIPFYDFSQIPYIDAWGRTEETGNLFERMLNNFVNPAYVKKERPTEIDGELERLYDLGETSVYPSRAKTNTKINGEYLTADEYVKYATTKGQTSYELAQGVINSAAYSGAADPEKAYMLKYVYSYADHIAKYEVNNDYSLAKWEMAAYKSSNPAQNIIDHAQEYYKRKEDDES